MKISAVETILSDTYPNGIWVRLETDEGLVGVGETFRNPKATEAYIHETLAPYLLGQDPCQPELHRTAFNRLLGNRFQGFPTRSIELRGNSAVDIALWDLMAKSLDAPLYKVLGGPAHKTLPVYNTCASDGYNLAAKVIGDSRAAGEGEDDLALQVSDPGRLARSLLDDGITGMKIWPYDRFAAKHDGWHIDRADLEEATDVIAQIRDAVGDEIEIMLEYHGLWRLPAALDIAEALGQYRVYWHEDPIDLSNIADLRRYRDETGGRVAASENLGTTRWLRDALVAGAVDVVQFDMGWVGGISEGKRIQALAEAFDRPIAPHDCVGPILFAADCHLAFASPNTLTQEIVRAYLSGWYSDVASGLPEVKSGQLQLPKGPGHGADFALGFLDGDGIKKKKSCI